MKHAKYDETDSAVNSRKIKLKWFMSGCDGAYSLGIMNAEIVERKWDLAKGEWWCSYKREPEMKANGPKPMSKMEGSRYAH